MRNKIFSLLVFSFCISIVNLLHAQGQPEDVQNVKVYYEPGMYGGWPANFGIWNWGDEILVGFSKGYYKDLGAHRHNFDREKTEYHMLARSLDGGSIWNIEDPGRIGNGDLVIPNKGSYHGVIRTDVEVQEPVKASSINFEDPNLAFTVRMTDSDGGEAWYWYSYDRGHNWEGPVELPDLGTPGIAARTDYVVESKKKCMLFLTAGKSNGKEGRVMNVKTNDGGINWSFVSWIGPEPDGFSIMPASVRLSKKEILVTTRRREGPKRFIGAYSTKDNGITWNKLENPVDDTGEGNPPAMVKMKDGRICLVYGYRAQDGDIENGLATSDIRAKISSDNGKTWSKAYILRNDGSGRDIGYPRVVQRSDGKIVALYYFMDKKTGPERYIAATIWNPPTIGNE
ncbi:MULTISPECIES: sialidase family protein [unclassified Arenibacter]|uniref:sialidase family protein n=1 Tax=unclassified Arenibacter TaxID=2615047 RepID=UPI000E3481F9|nr:MULTISPECIES: sialidase family protein [unclassified Arenibacter]MCM4162666.1 hypothetical protein [Arenibacter sp. A80]RFT58231.1 exo-alpha-sialidase [Arenibacter sp. P308M17]